MVTHSDNTYNEVMTDDEELAHLKELIAYHKAQYLKLAEARKQIIQYAAARMIIYADPTEDDFLYIGPQPFGENTQTYKARYWRMVSGKYAERYIKKYMSTGITKPLEDAPDPTPKPLTSDPKHRVAKGYRRSKIGEAIHDPYGFGTSDPYKI